MKGIIKNAAVSLLVCMMLPLTGMVSLAGQWEQDHLGIWSYRYHDGDLLKTGQRNAIVLMHRAACIRTRLRRMDTRLIPPGHGCRTESRRPGQSAVRGQEGRLAWHP